MASSSHAQAAEAAVVALLAALDVPAGAQSARAAARAGALWAGHLLAGERADLAALLGPGIARRQASPVCVTGINVHLVCPHHLTVAFGQAHLAYLPAGRVVGFGRLSELARACTARLVMQEDACQQMAAALCRHLGAAAAVAWVEASHPCHNVTRPAAHAARASTFGEAGLRAGVRTLRRVLVASTRSPRARR